MSPYPISGDLALPALPTLTGLEPIKFAGLNQSSSQAQEKGNENTQTVSDSQLYGQSAFENCQLFGKAAQGTESNRQDTMWRLGVVAILSENHCGKPRFSTHIFAFIIGYSGLQNDAGKKVPTDEQSN